MRSRGRITRSAIGRRTVEALFVQQFLEAAPGATGADRAGSWMPRTIRCMRHQEGRFFHGYYDGYCYLPLYIFCGRHLPWRPSCGARISMPRLADGRRGGPDRFQGAPALAACAHPAAGGFGLCPRGADGLVRSQTGSTTCSAWRAIPGWWRRLRRSRRRPGPRPRRRVGRPDATRHFLWSTRDSWSCIGAGWWARRSGPATRPIPASW